MLKRKNQLPALLALVSLPSITSRADLLNGGFESPPLAPDSIAVADPTSWTGTGSGPSAPRLINGNYGVPEYPGPQEGQQYVALGGGGTLSQQFTILASADYELVWFDNAGDHSLPSPYSVTISGIGGTLTSQNLDASHFPQWQEHSIELSLDPGNYTLEFASHGAVFGLSSLIDNVSLNAPVPETSSTVLLLSIGLCGIVVAPRRHTRLR